MRKFVPNTPLFEVVDTKAKEYLADTSPDRQRVLEELLQLVRRLATYLVWQTLSEDREDIVQEITIAAWQGLLSGRWDGTTPFSAYVAGIKNHLCFRYYRQRLVDSDRIDSFTFSNGHDADAFALKHKLVEKPKVSFDGDFLNGYGFTPAEKQVVELRSEGYSYTEISVKTGRAEGSVSSLLSRARKKVIISKN